MKNWFVIFQAAAVIVVSPLVTGIIAKAKNNIRMRMGASLLQPYYDLFKLFKKEVILPSNSSWIFKFAPFAALASSAGAAAIIMPVYPAGFHAYAGDLFVLVFVLGFGRFFVALAGLDAGSAFGGMGSSREMFVSAVAEPAALLALFAASLSTGTTDPSAAAAGLRFSPLIAGAALFIVMLAETSRIPIDNRETHLELTMIHEAMVLEYSGRNLALIELASHVKQLVFLTLIANIIFPSGIYALKIFALAGVIAVVEVSTAKIRLFRVVDLLAFGFVLASLAVIVSAMGV